jgi:uncharacterized cupin superfamily protein
MREAELRETEAGLVPEGPGWFVLNLRDARWSTFPGGGTWVSFEADGVPQQIGAGVHVLMPGESPGRYHSESDQEGFFVLAGECVLVVEGEERRLRPWDYFHCPPGTAHITVGASEEPCAIFMLGARTPGGLTDYIPDPVAAQHGASVKERTGSSKEAYADLDRTYTSVRAPWPPDQAAG